MDGLKKDPQRLKCGSYEDNYNSLQFTVHVKLFEVVGYPANKLAS